MSDPVPPPPEKSAAGWRWNLAVFGGLLCLSLLLQWHAGAYRSDFGGHADEAAHVVTGLMVRDYLAGGFLDQPHPMRFAEDYYERFPKVAIGHYPPLFYLVEGLWLIPFRSGPAILVLMALLSAGVGWLTWFAGRQFLSVPAAVSSSLAAVLLPLSRTYTAIVMADLLLVMLCLGAILALARFLERERLLDSIGFGLLAAAAILTKGSGLFLALTPPIALFLCGKPQLLKNWRLWIAPVPVVVLAFPWILFTRHITAEGMTSVPPSEYIPEAFVFYFFALWEEFRFGVLLLILLTIGHFVVRAVREKKPFPIQPSVHVATLIALLSFFCVVPSGLDARYLLPAVPSAILLAFTFRPRRWSLAFVWFLFAFTMLRPVSKLYTGASESIEVIASFQNANSINVLVSSTPNGEGALIAASALIDPKRFRMLRASKELAQSDWLGREYRDRFASPAELAVHLGKGNIDFIIFDRDIPKTQIRPYHELLEEASRLDSGHFERIETVASRRKVYGDATFDIERPLPSESLDFQKE